MESNTDYDFELNINTETELTDDVYLIKIVEVTKYFSEKTLARENFSKFNGIKTISVKTSSEIDHIEIRIENKLNQKLTINELKVNGKSYIIEYKIIPEPVIRVFTTFNFKNSSVWQRADYWQDAMKIIKEHWLFGAGGNTWRMLYGQNQSYLYYAKEAHCYILELWMSFGLLGLISYIFILVITIKNVYKMLKKTQDNRDFMAILVGISIIVVHGLMDFDMSYLIIEMIFYMYIAILNKNDKVEFKKINILEIFIIVIMTIISIGNVLGFFADILTDETGMPSNKIAPWVARHEYNRVVYLENHKIQDENEIRYIEEYIENEPYQRQNIMYEIMTNKLIEKLDSQNIESHIKDIKYLVNTWKSVKRETKYDIIAIQERAEIMLNLAKSCKLKAKENANKEIENLSNEILELIKEEYSENVMIIIDYKKNRELESITKFKYQYYTKVYREAVELLEKQ